MIIQREDFLVLFRQQADLTPIIPSKNRQLKAVCSVHTVNDTFNPLSMKSDFPSTNCKVSIETHQHLESFYTCLKFSTLEDLTAVGF